MDPCVFYSKSGLLRMIVFVDDCNWRGCPKESADLVKLFETRWQAECKPCKYFLNMRLGRDDQGYINISQPHYADHMAKVFNLQSEKLARTPLPPGTSVSKLERANFKEKVHHKLEKSKVKRDTGGPGSLLRYLCTRSVRAVAVNTVTHEHDVEHEQTVGFLMLRCEDNKDE